MRVTPYLFFDGRCEEAFNFYAETLGGKIESLMRHTGTPAAEHVPAEWQDKVMHARVSVGDTVIMGSDSPPDYYAKPQGFSVALSISEPAEAERVFAAFANGGDVTMALDETFFASRFGMLTDRFGTRWMIVCERPMQH